MKKKIISVLCLAIVVLLASCNPALELDPLSARNALSWFAADFDIAKILEDAADGSTLALDVDVNESGTSNVYDVSVTFDDYAIGDRIRINDGEFLMKIGTDTAGNATDFTIGTGSLFKATLVFTEDETIPPTYVEIPLDDIRISSNNIGTITSGLTIDGTTLILESTGTIVLTEPAEIFYRMGTAQWIEE